MRTVLGGGSVFADGAINANTDVAIEGTSIVAIDSDLDGDERMDVTGRTVLPGLIDCHVHVTYSHIDIWKRLNQPWSLRFYEATANLRRTLAGGVTTVRDAGGADSGIREAVARGLIPGPEMHVAVRMISQTGGHSDKHLACGANITEPSYPGSPYPVADGPDEVRRLVRELIANGANVIKVATSGGVTSPRDDPRHGHYRDDELTVIVAEATAAGIPCMAHAQGTDGIKSALRTGFTSIEHGVYLDDECIEMMLAAGTFFVPTLAAPRAVAKAAEHNGAPEYAVQKNAELMDIHSTSVRQAIAAGVTIAMGTDSGVAPHGRNLAELAYLTDHGMSPVQALEAASVNAARLLGVQDRIGRLAPGFQADVLVVDGSIDDLSDLPDRVEAVWQAGELIHER
jgi:imidazolonepropionase-like amidohydrolase